MYKPHRFPPEIFRDSGVGDLAAPKPESQHGGSR